MLAWASSGSLAYSGWLAGLGLLGIVWADSCWLGITVWLDLAGWYGWLKLVRAGWGWFGLAWACSSWLWLAWAGLRLLGLVSAWLGWLELTRAGLSSLGLTRIGSGWVGLGRVWLILAGWLAAYGFCVQTCLTVFTIYSILDFIYASTCKTAPEDICSICLRKARASRNLYIKIS